MLNKKLSTTVKDGNVYVHMDELLEGLYGVCNQWSAMYTREMGTEKEAAQRLIGMIDLCKGLEFLHEELRKREGLT